MLKVIIFFVFCFIAFSNPITGQEKSSQEKVEQNAPKTAKKTNQRPNSESSKTVFSEPFATASIEKMASQCVKFETEAGVIEMEMFPESAPESVRSFLNLTAIGAFDTTTFNRIVPGFIIQGGDIFTRGKMTAELDKRARQSVRDEPSLIKHERGIVSLARASEPNSATTNFFILVDSAPHLDGTFAAFGRVIKGMETVDAINKMPVDGEKPKKPVQILRATVAACQVQ